MGAYSREKQLPVMPRGEGSFSWANENQTLLRFTRTHDCSLDGKKYRVIVCGKNKTECLKKFRERARAKDAEVEKMLSTSIENPKAPLGVAMMEWLRKTKAETVKATTYDRDERTIRNQIQPYAIGKKEVMNVTEEDIKELLRFLQVEKKYSDSVMFKTYEILNQFFTYVCRESKRTNPMLFIKRPRGQKEVGEITIEEARGETPFEELVLTDEEISRFKRQCFKSSEIGTKGRSKYGVALYFMHTTFIRIGEVTALTWGDIDFKNKRMTINKTQSWVTDREHGDSGKQKRILTKPKTKSSIREVVLTDEAIKALRAIRRLSSYKKEKDFVLCTESGGMVSKHYLSDELKKILEVAGLNKDGRRDSFSPHWLRHSGISYYLRHGVPVDTISKMAGHANTRITLQTYYHVIDKQKETALKMMNAIQMS